jgi:hypothetical protein
MINFCGPWGEYNLYDIPIFWYCPICDKNTEKENACDKCECSWKNQFKKLIKKKHNEK